MRDRIDEELVTRRLARVLPGPDGEPSPVPDNAFRRLDPGRAGLRALVVVAVVVALVAAVIAWRSRPEVVAVAPGSTVDAPAAGVAGVAGTTGPAGPAGIVVAVAGRVRRPGLVRLPAGARVADAIQAAGGVLPGTDTSLVNLARKLTDGELVVLGVTPPPEAAGASGGGPAGGPVNLNTASSDQLQTLPGVGPVLADRILEYRDRNGGFKKVADLREVTGIGDARFAELKDLVTV